jgi:hypothetical protein
VKEKGRREGRKEFLGNKMKATTERTLSSFSLSLSFAITVSFLLYDLDPPIFSIIPFSYAFLFLFTIILKPIIVTFPMLFLFISSL